MIGWCSSPLIARSSMAERWWSTKVRRRPYDFFITDSFKGELLLGDDEASIERARVQVPLP